MTTTVLTFATEATANAAGELVIGTALAQLLEDHGGIVRVDRCGMYTVELDDRVPAILSTGERILWDLLRSIAGQTVPVNLWAVADRLDEHSQRGVRIALGVLFGGAVPA